MIITGGEYVIPDTAYVTITLADGRYVNVSAGGNIIVEAGHSDGFGEYDLTLPTLPELAAQCKALGQDDPMTHGEIPVLAYHRH